MSWPSTSRVSPAAARSTPRRSSTRCAWPSLTAALGRGDFDAVLAFVATGGYALGQYERYRRLTLGEDGLHRLADRRMAQPTA
jgi:hypothetical protein